MGTGTTPRRPPVGPTRPDAPVAIEKQPATPTPDADEARRALTRRVDALRQRFENLTKTYGASGLTSLDRRAYDQALKEAAAGDGSSSALTDAERMLDDAERRLSR